MRARTEVFKPTDDLTGLLAGKYPSIKYSFHPEVIRGGDGEIVKVAVTSSFRESCFGYGQRVFGGFINGRGVVVVAEGRDFPLLHDRVLSAVQKIKEDLVPSNFEGEEDLIRRVFEPDVSFGFDPTRGESMMVGILNDGIKEGRTGERESKWGFRFGIAGKGVFFSLRNITDEDGGFFSGESTVLVKSGKNLDLAYFPCGEKDFFVLGTEDIAQLYFEKRGFVLDLIARKFLNTGVLHGHSFYGKEELNKLPKLFETRRGAVIGVIGFWK